MIPLPNEKPTPRYGTLRWSARNLHRGFYLRLIGRLEKEGERQAANAIRGSILGERKP